MKNLFIEWQRLLDEQEETCQRCGSTEQAVEKASAELKTSLQPFGIEVNLLKRALDYETFKLNPSQSNRILINDRAIEEWLGAQTGQSPCCGPCGDAECRTIEVNGRAYETIPASLIVNAGLRAASQIYGVNLPQRELPASPLNVISESCC